MVLCFQDEEFDAPAFPQKRAQGFTAPLALLNDIAQVNTQLKQTVKKVQGIYWSPKRHPLNDKSFFFKCCL